MLDSGRPQLLISDTQEPFAHPRALEFCKYLKKHYKIPDNNIIHLGDEGDLYHASAYPKDPDAGLSAIGELKKLQDKIAQWSDVFPIMKLCISNHGIRWHSKAAQAQIPSELIKSYRDILKAPSTWQWRDQWVFGELPHPYGVSHGQGYSGVNGHRNAAIDQGMSWAIGHLHAFAAISYIRTNGNKIWAANGGCLIDESSFAFAYGKHNRNKPCLGTLVIFNGGSTPVWFPLE